MLRKLFQFFIFFLFTSIVAAQNVTHVAITVHDLQKSIAFYSQLLDFTVVQKYSIKNNDATRLFGIKDSLLSVNVARLSLGKQHIELMQFESLHSSKMIPLDSKSNDLWFQHVAIVVSDMDQAYQKLRAYNVVHVSTSPQTLPDYIPAAVGIKAFYFRDPDGHNLELISYPEGKGNPDWQNKKNLFLGIDHTAIGIASTQKSKSFYELAGLTVAGHSENFGTEQEHLNQVFGARLWITGLVGKSGIGVEFLEYIAPPGGRKFPSDLDAKDLTHWHTAIMVDDAFTVMKSCTDLHYKIISDGMIDYKISETAHVLGFMVKDQDNHTVFIYHNK